MNWDAIASQLHLGHHPGNPEGVVTHHPRRLPRCGSGRRHRRSMPQHPVYSCDPAHVPLQRLVLSLDPGAAGWRERPSAPGGPHTDFSADCEHQVSHLCRCADRVRAARPTRPSRCARAFATRCRPDRRGGTAGRPSSRVVSASASTSPMSTGLTEVYGPAAVCRQAKRLRPDYPSASAPR